MRLSELDPEWVYDFNSQTHGMRCATDTHVTVHARHHNEHLPVIDLPHAQGVLFLCPVCFKKNAGPIGTESVLCWFAGRGVPDDALPGPGRWSASGTSFDDLTLSPSVNVDHGHWHGYITNGEIVGGI